MIFCQARREFSIGQGVERVDVGEHELWLVKRANHVFTERMIDACFTTDR